MRTLVSLGDEFEDMRAAWLSTDPKRLAYDRIRTDTDVVFAAVSAARLHGIGDLWDRHHDFITRTRRQSQRSEIRYRQRSLAADDVVTVQGLPALSLEATVADLFNADADLRHIGNALRDAAHKGRLDFDRLQVLLAPYAAQAGLKKGDGAGLLEWLRELAGIDVASLTRLLSQSANYRGLAETAALVRNLDVSSRYYEGMTEVDAPSREPLSGPAGRRVLAHRGELRALLRRHGITNPEIFGSAARGDDREDSDIDLLVDFAPGTSVIDIIGIQRELRELLGVPVDLVPRNGLKERVRERAEKDLVPL